MIFPTHKISMFAYVFGDNIQSLKCCEETTIPMIMVHLSKEVMSLSTCRYGFRM